MSLRRIIDTFQKWRTSGDPMVLATVFETAGSTYSKSGHRILIAGDGDYQGLVSGGCLEGDLAERARRVAETGQAAVVTYDLRDEADELFGLGVGCSGMLRILLQRITAEDDYEPYARMIEMSLNRVRGVAATVVESGSSGLLVGQTEIVADAAMPAARTAIAALVDDHIPIAQRAMTSDVAVLHRTADGATLLYAPIRPVHRLLVLGAGLDAVPVVRIALELGYRVTVADHRPAYIEREAFAAADQATLVDPHNLDAQLDVRQFDAVVVMSHHLDTDKAYLRQLAGVPLLYLGVLGPADRRQRILSELGEIGVGLRPYLRGPVGLDIHADSPEAIALSIVAEIHVVLTGPRRREEHI